MIFYNFCRPLDEFLSSTYDRLFHIFSDIRLSFFYWYHSYRRFIIIIINAILSTALLNCSLELQTYYSFQLKNQNMFLRLTPLAPSVLWSCSALYFLAISIFHLLSRDLFASDIDLSKLTLVRKLIIIEI